MVTTKYQAKDGRQFEDRREAEDWDAQNFKLWLESSPMIDAKHFFDSLAVDSDTYDSTNDKKLARRLLRQYWDKHVA